MNNLTIIQLIAIGVLTLFNMSFLYHDVMVDSLKTNGIIKEIKDNFLGGVLFTLNVMLIIFSVYVYIVNDVKLTDYLGPIIMFIVLCFIYMFTIGYAISCAMDLKILLEYFMESEYSKDTSTSLIEFKLDAVKLIKSSPKYLISYDINLYSDKIIDEEETIFPLFKELLLLSESIFENKLGALNSSPLLDSYLVENIPLLSTIMTILKDEKLVKSLNSDLGATELKDLNERFAALNANMEKGIKYIKNEKERYEKASETTEIVEGLNEVRSMKEMLDSLK